MDKIILAALLSEWEEKMSVALGILDDYPTLNLGRKKIYLQDSEELRLLWDIKGSIGNLIEALEKSA